MVTKRIYKVAFNEPPTQGDDRTEFYFSSLSAIYEKFSVVQVGCKVSRLWNIGVSRGKTYIGKHCRITSEILTSKPHKNAATG